MTTVPQTATPLSEALSRAITNSVPRLEERLASDPAAHLELIRQTEQARTEVDHLLFSSVLAARKAGHSWDAIGQTLSMSRQAAQQRFGKNLGNTPTVQTQRLTPLTALNEMEVLNRAGRYGWHSVGFGPLYHDMQHDTQAWEHRRVLAFEPSRATLEREGWQRVGHMWFPWVYYARPTGQPAVPMPAAELSFVLE